LPAMNGTWERQLEHFLSIGSAGDSSAGVII
jgi:hypothetical protein